MSSDARSRPNAIAASQVAARDSGVGEAETSSRVPAEAARDDTNEPVTAPPAKAGCWAGAKATIRRPLASSTAWPTWAANAIAVRITPATKRSDEACSMSCPGTLAARRVFRRPGRS